MSDHVHGSRDLGDEHYARIAELRKHFGYRYAPEIAELYGKPLATVRRWVNEARRRGLLEPWASRTCPTCRRPFTETEAE